MTTALRPYVLRAPLEIQPERALALVAQTLGGILLYETRRYSVRVEIQSESTEYVAYRIALNRETGVWSCGCPGWCNWHTKKGPDYTCKHLRKWVPPLEKALELQAAALTQPAGVWY